MLWDLIRDFFVMHVFGGTLVDGTEIRISGGAIVTSDETLSKLNDLYYCIGVDSEGIKYDMPLADWLSTTATIISITIIVVLCCLFVYKIIKLIGGLIR